MMSERQVGIEARRAGSSQIAACAAASSQKPAPRAAPRYWQEAPRRSRPPAAGQEKVHPSRGTDCWDRQGRPQQPCQAFARRPIAQPDSTMGAPTSGASMSDVTVSEVRCRTLIDFPSRADDIYALERVPMISNHFSPESWPGLSRAIYVLLAEAPARKERGDCPRQARAMTAER